jgi:hypothetical protein
LMNGAMRASAARMWSRWSGRSIWRWPKPVELGVFC